MKRIALSNIGKTVLVCVGIAVGSAGCGSDYHARQIVERNTDPGRIFQNITGTGELLINAGRIDYHQNLLMPDETKIDVWAIHSKLLTDQKASKGTVVVLHGRDESKASFPYFGVAQVLSRKGYDVILMDLRAHGRSSDRYVTYGAKEKHDVKAVVDILLREQVVRPPLYAFGATLGAATAIQYAAIDPRCEGVFAMAPYQDLRNIARYETQNRLNDEQFEQLMTQIAKIADFDPEEASAVEAARQVKVPLLLAHGLLDLTVPLAHSEAIRDAAGGPKKLLVITPGPEQIAMFTIMEDWIAEKIDMLAQTGLVEPTEP